MTDVPAVLYYAFPEWTRLDISILGPRKSDSPDGKKVEENRAHSRQFPGRWIPRRENQFPEVRKQRFVKGKHDLYSGRYCIGKRLRDGIEQRLSVFCVCLWPRSEEKSFARNFPEKIPYYRYSHIQT